jgi:hypothetical protein
MDETREHHYFLNEVSGGEASSQCVCTAGQKLN